MLSDLIHIINIHIITYHVVDITTHKHPWFGSLKITYIMKCQYWNMELIAPLHCTVVRENVIGVQLIFVLKTQASSGFNASATNLGCCFAQNQDGTECCMFVLDLSLKSVYERRRRSCLVTKLIHTVKYGSAFFFLSFSNNHLAAGRSRNLLSTSVIARSFTAL